MFETSDLRGERITGIFVLVLFCCVAPRNRCEGDFVLRVVVSYDVSCVNPESCCSMHVNVVESCRQQWRGTVDAPPRERGELAFEKWLRCPADVMGYIPWTSGGADVSCCDVCWNAS